MSVRSIELGRINTPRLMSATECAYLAGMIDADGSFFISSANLKDQGRPQFRATLSISNTNFEALREMQRVMGIGALNCGYRSEINAKWKDKGQLNIRGEHLRSLIPQVAPYLLIKGKQAAILQRLLDLKIVWSKSNDNWKDQEALYLECKQLNGRGAEHQPALSLVKPVAEVRLCSVDGCGSKHYSHGFCRTHSRRMTDGRDWEPKQQQSCKTCGAVFPSTARLGKKFCGTACQMKWHRREGCYTPDALVGARQCSHDGCEKSHHAKGLCRRHYMVLWHQENPEHRNDIRSGPGEKHLRSMRV